MSGRAGKNVLNHTSRFFAGALVRLQDDLYSQSWFDFTPVLTCHLPIPSRDYGEVHPAGSCSCLICRARAGACTDIPTDQIFPAPLIHPQTAPEDSANLARTELGGLDFAVD